MDKMCFGLYTPQEFMEFRAPADYKATWWEKLGYSSDPSAFGPCCVNESPFPEEGGQHRDLGKPRTDLLPPKVLLRVAEVFAYGCHKYAENNWKKGIRWRRLLGSILRHAYEFAAGSNKDKESGLHPLAHLICDAMMLLDTVELHPELDDR